MEILKAELDLAARSLANLKCPSYPDEMDTNMRNMNLFKDIINNDELIEYLILKVAEMSQGKVKLVRIEDEGSKSWDPTIYYKLNHPNGSYKVIMQAAGNPFFMTEMK